MLCSADFWERVISIADLMFAVPAIGKISLGSGGSCAAKEMVQSVENKGVFILDKSACFQSASFSFLTC